MTTEPKLPTNWRWIALEAVADIGAGNPAPQGLRYFENGSTPFVRTQDVGREGRTPCLTEAVNKVNAIAVEEKKLRLWPEGTLLIPKSGASILLNHRALLGRPAYVSSHLATVVARPGLSPEYLYYFSLTVDARKLTPASDYPSLRLADLRTVHVPLPPPDTQDAIVAILSLADRICRKRHRHRRMADKLLPTIFIEMFGDPGENPRGWPKKPLEDIGEVRQGVTKGRDLRGKKVIRAPYLRVANVQDGYLDLSEVKEIDVLESDLERYHLDRGDVLLTEGGDPDKLGRGFIWNGEIQGCIYQNHIFRVRVERQLVLPEFLAFLTRTAYAKSYFLKAAKRSSNLASINARQLRAFSVPLPPIGMQERFRDAFNSANQRLLAPDATVTAQALFARLLDTAFSGGLVA